MFTSCLPPIHSENNWPVLSFEKFISAIGQGHSWYPRKCRRELWFYFVPEMYISEHKLMENSSNWLTLTSLSNVSYSWIQPLTFIIFCFSIVFCERTQLALLFSLHSIWKLRHTLWQSFCKQCSFFAAINASCSAISARISWCFVNSKSNILGVKKGRGRLVHFFKQPPDYSFSACSRESPLSLDACQEFLNGIKKPSLKENWSMIATDARG